MGTGQRLVAEQTRRCSHLALGQKLSRVQILEAGILELTSPVQRVCVKERVIKFWLAWLLWVGGVVRV